MTRNFVPVEHNSFCADVHVPCVERDNHVNEKHARHHVVHNFQRQRHLGGEADAKWNHYNRVYDQQTYKEVPVDFEVVVGQND